MCYDSFSRDEDICIHYADEPHRFGGALFPPVYNNTLFVYPDFEGLARAEADQQHNYVYRRGKNPTVAAAEKKLAALEQGDQCTCFASGMAAISAALMNSTTTGDHVLCVGHIYPTTLKLLSYLQKFGVEYSIIYSTNLEEIEKAITAKTTAIFAETPSYLNLRLLNLKGISKIAGQHGIRTIVDNTWATPLYQKPLTMGIDIVVHSASKYLGGHSDLMGGVVITSKSIMEKLFAEEYLLHGGIMPPSEASKLIAGIKTLPARMRVHQENAMKVAQFLQSHPSVSAVHYPGLPSHPDYELGKAQLRGYSGLMSFELKNAAYEGIKQVISKLEVFQIGVSWGSAESLVWSPNYGNNVKKLQKEHISPGLIRLAVGHENGANLIADLNQALA
ncbi:trans-sulfuration enzyme family protein [Bacillus sp. T33-2]|uniref:trans-sulfuration enzyme family protein n=1 Tax=Bacillus sp. T33-2 TaxID=2054168 RepID=UPI002155EC5B|nr:PLP-dependent aspartate aminotransferase family protein [Bacillus sp. T33-2]